jgi:hypothetical protein
VATTHRGISGEDEQQDSHSGIVFTDAIISLVIVDCRLQYTRSVNLQSAIQNPQFLIQEAL